MGRVYGAQDTVPGREPRPNKISALRIITRDTQRQPDRGKRMTGSLTYSGKSHPGPNENAGLLGQAFMKDRLLPTQEMMGMVGAKGVSPTLYG
jgi:hypothetical protein